MRRVERPLVGGEGAPAVVLHLQLVFGMDGVFLPLHIVRVQSGRDEKLRKAVHGGLEMGRVDVEEVVGVVAGGVGVGAAAVGGYERLVAIDLRVFLGADEQHVLQEVRQPRPFGGFVERAAKDHQGGRRLVGVWIGSEQHPQAVVERQVPVRPVVIGAFQGRCRHLRLRSGVLLRSAARQADQDKTA